MFLPHFQFSLLFDPAYYSTLGTKLHITQHRKQLLIIYNFLKKLLGLHLQCVAALVALILAALGPAVLGLIIKFALKKIILRVHKPTARVGSV